MRRRLLRLRALGAAKTLVRDQELVRIPAEVGATF